MRSGVRFAVSPHSFCLLLILVCIFATLELTNDEEVKLSRHNDPAMRLELPRMPGRLTYGTYGAEPWPCASLYAF